MTEAWERAAATKKSVVDDIHPVPDSGLRITTPEPSELAETSPTYLKLVGMVEELNTDERMDLLVLWLGWGRSRIHSKKAVRLRDAQLVQHQVHSWIRNALARGLRRWSTWDRTISSRR